MAYARLFHGPIVAVAVFAALLCARPDDVMAQEVSPAPQAIPGLVLLPDQPAAVPIGQFIEMLDDDASLYTVQMLGTGSVSSGFAPVGADRLAFRGDRWLRLRIQSALTDEQTVALTFDSARIPDLRLFAQEPDGTYSVHNAGSLAPCDQREICSRFPSFLIDVPPNVTLTLFFRATADRLVSTTPHLRTVRNFASVVSWDRMAYGAQYGIIMALVLFHLVLFVFSRTRPTLFLGLFLLAAGAYGGVIEGTALRALPIDLTSFDRAVTLRVLEGLAILSLLRFGVAHMVSSDTSLRRTTLVLRGLTALAVLCIPVGLLFPFEGAWLNGVVGVLVLGTLLYLALLTARDASWPSQLHAFAFYALTAGFALYAFSLYAVAQSESEVVLAIALPIDLYGLPTTLALFAVFGTMTVVRDLYRARRERDIAQADTLQQLLDDKALREEWNVHLEKEIEKRTFELEKAKSQLEEQNFELRRHERQLEAQALQLQELQAHKSRFFAYISHEFRTPITLIRARVEDIVSDIEFAKPADTQRRLDTVLKNTYRLEHLVDEVLDLSRVEDGTVVLRAALTDFTAFVHRIVDQHGQLAEQKELTVDIGTDPGPILAYFDEEMLTKVVANLLSNAFKFSSRGSRVDVWISESSPEPDRGYVRLDVADQGPGIAQDDIPHIFERFFQSVRPESQPRVGHGLGLSLTKHLVELHGGEIRVSSNEGAGSIFSVFLPKGRAHLTDAEILPERPAAAVPIRRTDPASVSLPEIAGQPRLLIVEDEPELLSYLREHFEVDYDVATAADGMEGLKTAREVRPELIVTDVLMPRMDGLEMLAAIRSDANLENTPVIILSAKASIEDRLSAYQAAADGYISKPFDMAELRLRVRNTIRTRRALQFSRAEAAVSIDGTDIPVNSIDSNFLASARSAVMEHLDEEDFDVEAFAAAMNVSSRTLHRRIRELVDMAPAEFVRTIKLQAARHLIEQNAVSTVSEVASRVGFRSASYFGRLYREVFGESPADLLGGDGGA